MRPPVNSRRFAAALAALAALAVPATPGIADDASGGGAKPAFSLWQGYVRVMPRFYSFTDDQAYLQRYRSLDAANEDELDVLLATVNELGLVLAARTAGPAVLEVVHTNPFVLNDRWMARYRPDAGSRLELAWHEYQRPLESFLPSPAVDSVTYARRYNDGRNPEQELYRRRGDLSVTASVAPYVWSDGAAFLRDVELGYTRSTRSGYGQFNWIFGVVEDLVVPAGDSPERWRGRTETIDQIIDRYRLDTTLALGRGNVTRLVLFGERFDNGAPTVTNADIASSAPAINTQARTVNYIADYRLEGAALAIQQAIGRRLTLLADAATETLEQESLAPLESQAAYEGKIRTQTAGIGLAIDATDALVVEAASTWSKRTNETPVGTAAATPRAYLLQDRNLSTPFLRERRTTVFGGSLSWYARSLTARAGATHEDTERELVRGSGSNAIPEGMTVYHATSTPTTYWISLSGRTPERLKWAARIERRQSGETWTAADPEVADRVRANATYVPASGSWGLNASLAWESARNDGLVLQGAAASAPQRMELSATNLGLSGWLSAGSSVQLYGAYQRIARDQEGNLLLTDIRRWRARVLPRLADAAFAYESTLDVWTVGAPVSLGESVSIVATVTYTTSDGGIQSAVAPVGEFTRIANDALAFGVGVDYRLSPRWQANCRYAYETYDDEASPELSGRLQEAAIGLTFSF
jgi:hypothetical protein